MSQYAYSLVSLVARASTTLLGLAAVAWAVFVLPNIFNQARLTSISQSIVAGNDIDPEFLAKEAQAGSDTTAAFGLSHPKTLSALAFIRIHLLERSLRTGNSPEVDQRFVDAITAIHASLDVSPADPFLWFSLFWSSGVTSGFTSEQLRLLHFSYEFGPRESWIAVKRNRLALQIYPFLDAELADAAVREFVGLVESGFYSESADLLTGPGWPNHDLLLSHLETVPLVNREELAATLRSRGYDLTPPGVTDKGPRSWD